jgi:hypothetical protein
LWKNFLSETKILEVLNRQIINWRLKMEFNELKGLYDHLEVNAGEYKYNHNIANLFQKLRDI